MNKLFASVLTVLLFTLAGCEKDDNFVEPKEFTFNFMNNAEGWLGDFADYPNDPGVEDFYELEFSHATLPSPLNTSEGALRQSGNNHSDDLFMFVKKKITGLKPNTNYKIELEIEFATNAASGSLGVGGSPAESVYIKAGASTNEPMKVLDNSDNNYRMNIDKGNQSIGGTDMKVIGDFANGTDLTIYKIKQLNTATPLNVQANQQGEIWLVIGTDSGFEGKTTIFYNSIQATIK